MKSALQFRHRLYQTYYIIIILLNNQLLLISYRIYLAMIRVCSFFFLTINLINKNYVYVLIVFHLLYYNNNTYIYRILQPIKELVIHYINYKVIKIMVLHGQDIY